MKGISLCADCAYYSLKKHKCTRGCTVDPNSSKGDNPSFYLDCPLPEVEEKKQWIPCSERLPEQTGYYLVCDSTAEFDNTKGRQDVSKFVIGRHGGHWYGAIRRENITHWMPLPEPPEVTQDE